MSSAPPATISRNKRLAALRARTTDSGGCWEWDGCVQSNGYARVRIGGVTRNAHRVAKELATGRPIQTGMDVCHRCDNRRCINPAHLFIGTRADNMRDCVAKGRQARGLRLSVLRRGERAPRAKLNWPQVRAIRAAAKTGARPQDLAVLYGVDASTIWLIRRYATWKEGFAAL